jgi:hypothetical protein
MDKFAQLLGNLDKELWLQAILKNLINIGSKFMERNEFEFLNYLFIKINTFSFINIIS